MAKIDFIARFKAARVVLETSLAELDETTAGLTSAPAGHWPSIKDLIGHIAAWEREVLIADEMIKRGEQSHIADLNREQFNQSQADHRRSWTLAQLRTELDLNYEALLMAWDEYEDEDGPAGPASWQAGHPDSLWWLIDHQVEHGREIVARRGLQIKFPGQDK